MEIDAGEIRPSLLYQHLIHCIVPRPIAWVSTVSESGITNVAPFSFFSGVGSRPPSLLFCPANNADGGPKDTLRNIESTGEFVVNIVPEFLAEPMNRSAAVLPPDESEFDVCGLTSLSGTRVRAPRVAESPVQFECEVLQILKIGDGPGGANIVIGRILYVHVSDAVLGADGVADPDLLNAIGRMGGKDYCRTGDRFSLPRPE
ncbi:MAG: flavin reductase family protein [Planctomycetaceae bacterium]